MSAFPARRLRFWLEPPGLARSYLNSKAADSRPAAALMTVTSAARNLNAQGPHSADRGGWAGLTRGGGQGDSAGGPARRVAACGSAQIGAVGCRVACPLGGRKQDKRQEKKHDPRNRNDHPRPARPRVPCHHPADKRGHLGGREEKSAEQVIGALILQNLPVKENAK